MERKSIISFRGRSEEAESALFLEATVNCASARFVVLVVISIMSFSACTYSEV